MKIHSIVDLITNSSTELFVLKPKAEISEEEIYKLVHEKYEMYLELVEHDRLSLDVFEVREAVCDVAEPYKGYFYEKYDKGDILVSADDSDFDYEFQDVLLSILEKYGKVEKYHLG
jgi:hypothetical protein